VPIARAKDRSAEIDPLTCRHDPRRLKLAADEPIGVREPRHAIRLHPDWTVPHVAIRGNVKLAAAT
jgi:hypothetical protein